MKINLYEFLKHFELTKDIKLFIFNNTNNISDYYKLDEIDELLPYTVDDWTFNCHNHHLIISISK